MKVFKSFMNSIKLIVYILLVAVLFPGYIPVTISEDDNYTIECPQRFTGLRWVILYGSYEGIERFALQELYRMVERYQPYVPVVLPVPDKLSRQEDHLNYYWNTS